MKKIIFAILTILLALIVIFLFANQKAKQMEVSNFEECVQAGYSVMESYPRKCATPDGKTFTENIGNVLEKQDLIRLNEPRPNDTITSPIQISGEARGAWYFEASFSAKVTDSSGSVLGEGPVQAQDDWMTEDFVPFQGEIEFKNTTSTKGNLILEKANPSGLEKNADQLRVPVKFSQTTESATTTVKVHFSTNPEGSTSCKTTEPAKRTIPKTKAVGTAAIQQLLEGPTQEEQTKGLHTNIPDGVQLQSLKIENGLAEADFNEALNQAAGSCRVTAIRSQITNTLLQFPTVDEVEISVNGETEEVLQP